MQILLFQPSASTVLSLWEDVQNMQKQEAMWVMAQLKEYISTVLWRYEDIILFYLESVYLDDAVLFFNNFSQC